jgi:hypothetical protein
MFDDNVQVRINQRKSDNPEPSGRPGLAAMTVLEQAASKRRRLPAGIPSFHGLVIYQLRLALGGG